MVIIIKIGILTRNLTTNYKASVSGVANTYLNIIRNNHFPIIIDNNINLKTQKNDLINLIKEIDGFILPGGEEINDVDLFIVDYCFKNDIPLLGICLGMQEIGFYFSNALEKIEDSSHMDLEKKYLHDIKLNKDGYLFSLIKKEHFFVNSRHNYKVIDHNAYQIEATCNNVIEAIKVKNKKYILGVQFHPEIMFSYDENAKIIFDDFFNICKKNRL